MNHFISLFESYVNLFLGDPRRSRYAQEVFDMLQVAYKKAGGIQGNGFTSPQEMVSKIPMWKLFIEGGKIKAVVMYKDKSGRKGVAVASDGSPRGMEILAKIIQEEFEHDRSYMELSDRALSFSKRRVGKDRIKDFVIPFDKVKDYLDPEDEISEPEAGDTEVGRHPDLKGFYRRKFGPELHTKLMVGTPGKKIV